MAGHVLLSKDARDFTVEGVEGMKKKATETQHRDKKSQWQSSKHPNQRVVMVLREVNPDGGKGAIRTIVQVVRAEDRGRGRAPVWIADKDRIAFAI